MTTTQTTNEKANVTGHTRAKWHDAPGMYVREGDFIVTANEDGSPHINSKIVCRISEYTDLAVIERTIRCANAHDDLLAAAKAALATLEGEGLPKCGTAIQLRAAIALAEGEQQ